MIKTFLVNDDEEVIFKSLSVAKKIRYYEICNSVDEKKEEFIIIADIKPEGYGDSYVSSGHYNNGVLVLDTSTIL